MADVRVVLDRGEPRRGPPAIPDQVLAVSNSSRWVARIELALRGSSGGRPEPAPEPALRVEPRLDGAGQLGEVHLSPRRRSRAGRPRAPGRSPQPLQTVERFRACPFWPSITYRAANAAARSPGSRASRAAAAHRSWTDADRDQHPDVGAEGERQRERDVPERPAAVARAHQERDRDRLDQEDEHAATAIEHAGRRRSASPMKRAPFLGVTIQRPVVPFTSACAKNSILRSKSSTDADIDRRRFASGISATAHMMPRAARSSQSNAPSLRPVVPGATQHLGWDGNVAPHVGGSTYIDVIRRTFSQAGRGPRFEPTFTFGAAATRRGVVAGLPARLESSRPSIRAARRTPSRCRTG